MPEASTDDPRISEAALNPVTFVRSARVTRDAPVTARLLRPLLGTAVVVRTATRTVRGTLLSCVKGSAWLVVDDTDVVLHLDEIVSVRPT